MKRGTSAMLVSFLSPFLVAAGCADGSPISGDYCAKAEPTKCVAISFPPRRGTEAPGTMTFEGKRYELSWMELENGQRKYVTNLPSGPAAFEVVAVDARTVVLKWRDRRPEQTYALK